MTGTCLICQTLDVGARPAAGTAPSRRPGAVAPSGPRVVPPDAPRLRSSFGVRVIGGVVAAVMVVLLAWAGLHLVFAVVHILELIGVALIAGYIGWAAGVHHGQRSPRR